MAFTFVFVFMRKLKASNGKVYVQVVDKSSRRYKVLKSPGGSLSSKRWALAKRRSMMALAKVGSSMYSCHLAIGSCEALTTDFMHSGLRVFAIKPDGCFDLAGPGQKSSNTRNFTFSG